MQGLKVRVEGSRGRWQSTACRVEDAGSRIGGLRVDGTGYRSQDAGFRCQNEG